MAMNTQALVDFISE
jgi:hypothetical protein